MTSVSAIAGRVVLVGIVLMQSPGKAVSQESGTAGIADASATPESRLACPPDAKVDEALTLIRAAYEEAYDTAKDTGEPDPLIEQLTALADQATDPAKTYALLLEAEAIATQYENYSTALDLLERRAQRFRIDGLKLRSQLLKRLAGPKVAADLVLFDQASDTAEKAMQAERFDVASEAAALAVSVAKAIDREQKAEAKKRGRLGGKAAGKDESGPTPVGPGLVKKATALQSRVTAAQKLFVEYGEALTQLKSQPDDAAANTVAAKYLCFVRGEWQKGLPVLAKSDIDGLRDVAAAELALVAKNNLEPKQQLELAGKWWSASDAKGISAEQESAIKDHAASFYADVADRLTDPLEKRLAMSRLRGLATQAERKAKQSAKVALEGGVFAASPGQKLIYLSDIPEFEAKVVHFGFGKGTIKGKSPIRSIVDGRESPHGLSMHPGDGPNGDCFVKYTLPKGAVRFSATTTLDQGGSFDHCGIGFEVIADGKSVWKSKAINKDNRFEECDVAIEDCRSLELRTYTVTAAFGGHAVWIEPRITLSSAGAQPHQAGLGGRWLESLEPDQLKTRYWKILNAGLPDDLALNVYNDDEGRGRCRAFVGRWAAFTGQLWDLREPGVFSNKFLHTDRVLSIDTSGEVYMGSRHQQQDGFWATRNPDGKSFKIQTSGGYLSAERKTDGQDVRVFLSPKDLGDRSDWVFLPTDQLIVQPEPLRP